MSNETAAARVTHFAQDVALGPDDVRRCLVHKTIRVAAGALAATVGTASGNITGPLAKNIIVTSVRILPLVAVANDAANFITVTIGYNNGAGGGITDIAHWSTVTGSEGALAALTNYPMAVTGAHTAFTIPVAVAAGQCLTYTFATAAAGVANNNIIEIEYDEVG